jgi:DNA polymerase
VEKDQLIEHLEFARELGVTGIARDAALRRRPGETPRAATPDAGPAAAVDPDPAAAMSSHTAAVVVPATFVSAKDDALAVIRADLGDCTRCTLHTGRTNIVFGVGNAGSPLMFVGEGPGADEDQQGLPFVGRAGQLLSQIIKAMGFERDAVYIANIVKCRPPGNRTPEPDEIAACQPFLRRQIETIKPQIIVALGSTATQALLGTTQPISRLRGRFHQVDDVRVMPTFHPSYLLRNPSAKREVWEDMKLVMKALER